MAYPIPKAAAIAWDAFQAKSPQNPGLIFDRFAPDWANDKEAKKRGLVAVRDAANQKTDVKLLDAWNARWKASVNAAHAEPVTLKTDWRFIAGLGRKGPLEVGFTFHRYGFPMLPGSSVKGIARASARLLSEVAEDNPDFIAIFGYAPQSSQDKREAQSGGAAFFDAIPVNKPTLELDIMNPHYPRYYSGNDAPTDSQSPIPVNFLTVAANTEFHFAVGWRTALTDEARRLRDLAVTWLKQGLLDLGAGGKTSAGYGYFVETPSTATKKPATAATAQTAANKVVPPAEQRIGQGKVRYNDGKAYVVDQADPNHRYRANWKELRMNDLADKTVVDFTVEAQTDGRWRLIKVLRR